MASIYPISAQKILTTNNNVKNTKTHKKNIIKLHTETPNILNDYLSILGKQNESIIAFKAKLQPFHYNKQNPLEYAQVKPYGMDITVDTFRPSISDYAKWKIRTEATNRIYGLNNWPQIDHINAWMVTAETDRFMPVGGLAKVAADLPNSFNRRFNNNQDQMFVVTPMYTDKNKKLIEDEDKLTYQYSVKKRKDPITGKDETIIRSVDVKFVGKINVPLYNPQTNTKTEDTEVRIYKGYTDYSCSKGGKAKNDGTYYYFLHTPESKIDANGNKVPNAQIFNIEDANPKSPNNGTPYANNKFGTDEVFRMAFFSKAVYEMMKNAKEEKIKDIKAPNSVILNDWHAGGLAAMIHYTANAEADTGVISKQAGRYFNEIPTIYIAHNVEHQGSTNNDTGKRTSIFATLFGGYSMDIIQNAQSWDSGNQNTNPPKHQACALMNGEGFSSAMAGMTLADRVVPVSEHYANELTISNVKANGLSALMKTRANSPNKTLTPITNGYSKNLIAPTPHHMKKLLKATKEDFILNKKESIDFSKIELLPYDKESLENKVHNKNMIMDIFKQTIERERKLMENGDYNKRKYLLHDPFNTDISDIKDFSNVPLIAYSGRIDPQKGLDTILKDAIWKFAENNINTPKEKLPVFIIGGTISQDETYNALAYDLKDALRQKALTEKNEAKKQGYLNIANRIILINGFVRTDLVATAADFFLVPSKFEPCGLTQLEAMAKGALPIATSTGGLVNTIKDNVDGFRTKEFYDMEGWRTTNKLYGSKDKNEFVSNGEAYCEALERALNTYHNNHAKFEEMQKAAMDNDFSWDKQGGALDKYINLIKTGRTQ